MLVGAHLSVAGGYERTARYAQEVGAECMQIFAKSPRQWHAKPLDRQAAEDFSRLRIENRLGPLFTHTAYLINLSTDDDVLRARSVQALADEIERARILGAEGAVTHVGNDPCGNPRQAALRAAQAIEDAFAHAGEVPRTTRLLLENTAGAGRSFGCSFEELGAILEALSEDVAPLVGICFDTCHGHAYGMHLSEPGAWARLLDEMERTCGPGRLGLIHANDCKFERGSRKDRHEWIGDGFIGYEGFSALVCEPRLSTVPAITEMPGEVPKKDIENISRLKRLREQCNRD